MSQLHPDMASKVLDADLRNLVKKVGDGSVLSPSERELVERSLATGKMPGDLLQQRRSALLTKWTKGGKLSESEKSEISALLVLIAPKSLTPQEAAPEPEAEAPAAIPTKPRIITGYKHPLKHYADLLQKAGMKESKDPERKLKQWKHKGMFEDNGEKRNPPDLPPFDDLGKMAAWWERRMEWKTPDYLLKLQKTDGEEPTPPAPTKPKSAIQQTGDPVEPGMAIPDIAAGDHSSDIGINYIRGLVQSGIEEMNRARAANDSKRYWNARRQFEDDVETLRKWEKDLVKIQEGKGEVLRANVMNEVVARMFSLASQSFTNGLFDIAKRLAPEMPVTESRALVLPLRDKIFAHLKKTQFAEVWKQTTGETE